MEAKRRQKPPKIYVSASVGMRRAAANPVAIFQYIVEEDDILSKGGTVKVFSTVPSPAMLGSGLQLSAC